MAEHIAVGPDGHIVEVHDPGSTGYQIDKMYAIVAADSDGEGIMAVRTDMGWMPLISSSEEGIEKYVETAQQMADASGAEARIIEFSTRRLVRTINRATS